MIDMEYFGETLSVAELIEELRKLPPDLPVLTEGCDCDGTAGSVWLDGDRVYVRRSTRESIERMRRAIEDRERAEAERMAELRRQYPDLQ